MRVHVGAPSSFAWQHEHCGQTTPPWPAQGVLHARDFCSASDRGNRLSAPGATLWAAEAVVARERCT